MSDFIPVSVAAQMNADYRTNREAILKTEYQGQNVLAICETFQKEQVQTLLDKPGCEFLRIYYGMDASMKVHAVLCAADKNNADILPSQTNALSLTDDDEYTLENGQRCPEECPPGSVLNEP